MIGNFIWFELQIFTFFSEFASYLLPTLHRVAIRIHQDSKNFPVRLRDFCGNCCNELIAAYFI